MVGGVVVGGGSVIQLLANVRLPVVYVLAARHIGLLAQLVEQRTLNP